MAPLVAGLALPIVVPPIREAMYKPETKQHPKVQEVGLPDTARVTVRAHFYETVCVLAFYAACSI